MGQENLAIKLDRLIHRMIDRFLGDDSIMDFIITRTFKVVMIGFLMLIAIRLVSSLEKFLLEFLNRKRSESRGFESDLDGIERDKRVATVLKVLGTVLRVMITAFALIMLTKEMGLDITPLITGAGIAGVALGFGAQSLVKDIISGIFLLLENQIRIGDSIRINSLSGTVERMELRVTVLRDLDGTLHIIPNGEIKAVSNMTYQWGRAVVDVPLAYQANIEKAVAVIQTSCQEFSQDSQWRSLLLENPQIQAITEFGSSEMKVRVLVKTGPADRYKVQTELRYRLKKNLDAARIPLAGTVAASGI